MVIKQLQEDLDACHKDCERYQDRYNEMRSQNKNLISVIQDQQYQLSYLKLQAKKDKRFKIEAEKKLMNSNFETST